MWIPVDDKLSTFTLPRRRAPSRDGVHVFFEELFPRCQRDDEFARYRNLVFFNLPFFRFPDHCDADGLIFNSRYLMECFGYEAFLHGAALPPMTDAPLELPLLDFPDGYPSVGGRLARNALRALAGQVHLGHALRGGKPDPFATLSIMHHLNQLAAQRSTRSFLLMIAARDLPQFEQAARDMPIPHSTIESLLPVHHLENRSVVAAMRHATFSLCYDVFVEAFGFYPVESVYCGCPVFSNGNGNLRYLLPPGAGIEVRDQLQMHFGPVEARVRAYRPVAERVFRVVTAVEGARLCQRGARYIDRHYSKAAFAHRIGRFLRDTRDRPARTPPAAGRHAQISPYLRLADWRRGRFVTDRGKLEVPAEVAAAWKRLLSSKRPRRGGDGPPMPPEVGGLRPA
ncbi:MAG TPA: hypothetical protein VHW23_19695 [Kofleriaceae bacterium]|nr:hypothetical protein [Kofleriaceae bacterium]